MKYFSSGSILDIIQNNDEIKFTIEDKLNICKQLTEGLWHLHDANGVHADLALR